MFFELKGKSFFIDGDTLSDLSSFSSIGEFSPLFS